MVSVASEIASSLSFQGPQRAQKSDAPANDSFASLVDSNAAAADNSRAAEASPPPANSTPAPRRQDDAAAAANSRARDNAPSDKPAKNDTAERDTSGRTGKQQYGCQAGTGAACQIEIERSQGRRSPTGIKVGFRTSARGRCRRDRTRHNGHNYRRSSRGCDPCSGRIDRGAGHTGDASARHRQRHGSACDRCRSHCRQRIGDRYGSTHRRYRSRCNGRNRRFHRERRCRQDRHCACGNAGHCAKARSGRCGRRRRPRPVGCRGGAQSCQG